MIHRRLQGRCRITLFSMCGAIWVMCVVGALGGQRTLLLQGVAWIPPVVAVIAAIALAAMARQRFSRFASVGALIVAATIMSRTQWTAGWFAASAEEASAQGNLVLVHLNARHPGEASDQFADALAKVDGDILVISEAGQLMRAHRVAEWKREGRFVHQANNVLVISKVEILAATPLLVEPSIRAVAIRVAASTKCAHPWSMIVVDLPSSWNTLRAESMDLLNDRVHQTQLGVVDLMIGDFNTTPGFTENIMPAGTIEAFAAAGSGMGATFPRAFPMWRIDQALVGPSLSVVRAETFDPSIGGHRGQRIWFAPAQ
ncbi:MAG: hypothetical protein O2800_04855 [Planctomycetota bacterium]|nr:hypothetical protein [Planctomycetota bacterium]